ncbi:MAG: hypothetical protein ACTTHG_05605 [Treponemataceae bacterium]
MAIQPIDLQTLYSQIEKVSKTVVQQQQGSVLQSAMMMDAKSMKDLEKSKTVEETKKNDKMNGIKDQKDFQNKKNSEQKNKDSNSDFSEEETPAVIIDPALGKKIDISG